MSDPTNVPYDKLEIIHDAVEIILVNMVWVIGFSTIFAGIIFFSGGGKSVDLSGLIFGYGILIILLNYVALGSNWKSITRPTPTR